MTRKQILEKNGIAMQTYTEEGKKKRSFTRGDPVVVTNYYANISLSNMEHWFGKLKLRSKW